MNKFHAQQVDNYLEFFDGPKFYLSIRSFVTCCIETSLDTFIFLDKNWRLNDENTKKCCVGS